MKNLNLFDPSAVDTTEWDDDLKQAWEVVEKEGLPLAKALPVLTLLHELWESRCCLSAFVQSYRTDADVDELESICHRAERLGHVAEDEGLECLECDGTGLLKLTEETVDCAHCDGTGKQVEIGG